ncbi:HlyD family secretion protein [Olivibacter sp. SDN3]|uniref:HlyD family secretion protein n=1 Tax=Olivibacter sp. SDN3 TaxID=2764720 RepID=UPI0016513C62|nr:HlyD family secretion protein [Olivibacter sp. SDN3]QNL51464.1 HlyD family secretion protein [Olivibacter sp. SDN3]
METNNQTTVNTPEKKSGNKGFAIVFALLILIGGTYGVIKYLHAQQHEETDDAQVVSTISPVIPRVSGYIKDVRVKDNQQVRKGDTLVILDNRDFMVSLAQAEAGLASAKSNAHVAGAGIQVAQANIHTSEVNIGTVEAQIESAKVNLWRAEKDFERYGNLIKDHSITQQQYEEALANKQLAEKQLAILETQRQSADRQAKAISTQKAVSTGQVSVADATIKQREAEVESAQLSLSYTVITAAIDGQVGKVNLQPGQYLAAGQSLFSIVPLDEKWVIANFKETQLTRMELGQKVSITVDAYPDVALEGTVVSFSPATGAIQSLLPPDNASGNFVKVVQRIPVRIDFEEGHDPAFMAKLRTGMNVLVDVHL